MLGVLDPHGPVGSAEQLILRNATAIMLVVVIPVIVLTLAFAWWYRAGNQRAAYRPDWAYSGQIELVVWSIPAMVVILLAGVGWIGSHELDPARRLHSRLPPLRIDVVALDWKWLFIYPDHRIATVNDLVVPAGAPLEFVLTSATVMNAFFVPQLGSQIYAMPGMATRLNLLAADPGEYWGESSHFSGDGFAGMRFPVHALPAADFERWLARTQATGEALSPAAYALLLHPGSDVPARSFRGIEAGLLERIMQRTAALPAAAAMTGPAAARGAPSVR
jgi:cytochrome o ubiquinol oxidase subunit 2